MTKLMTLAVAIVLLVTCGVSHAGLMVTGDSGFAVANYDANAVGTVFTTGSTALSVTAVGFFDYQGNGLADSHEVRIYQMSSSGYNNPFTAALLATATITSADTLVTISGDNAYRFQAITPVTLQPNTTYAIVGKDTVNDYVPNWAAFAPVVDSTLGLTNIHPQWAAGFSAIDVFGASAAPGQFGSGWDSAFNDGAYFWPNVNMQVTPEPATMALLALGGIGAMLRRKNA
jgi:hypothetical protein